MWRDYSLSYIKNNRASGISVTAAALTASLFLSLLCSLFYSFWQYDIEQIVLEEGNWQGRITAEISGEDMALIESFSNVERAVVNEELSRKQGMTVDIYFQNVRTIFQDMPLITEKLGLEEDRASYHLLLLSRYLVHDPQDENPPLLLSCFLALLFIVSLSLILIIHNSFAVSMNVRVRQLGIFSSIGATPGQIRTCLMQEAAALCILPILSGSLVGIALSRGVVWATNILAKDVAGRHEAVFQYHPLVFAITVFVSVLTVFISAWLPAGRVSRLTPLQAIRGEGGQQFKRKKRSPILTLLFGVEGELAGNALKAQRKALRTSTLSLTLSFLGFMLMLCFFTLSGISMEYTYFERYQDAWDIMVTVKDTGIEDLALAGELRRLEGVRDCAVYQKAEAVCRVSGEAISEELAALGGPEAVAGPLITVESAFGEDYRLIKAPVVVLDDVSFGEYCERIGIEPALNGTIILNRFWDSINSNFRYPKYVPFVKEDLRAITLCNAAQSTGQSEERVEIPVLATAWEAPLLKEEYENYALAQFLPLSLWERISGQIGGREKDSYVRILAGEGAGLAEMNGLEAKISQLLGGEYETVIENRIQDRITNDYLILGYKLLIGGFCVLFALIGIANVFSNTFGFLRQRKREFAQYMSVGLTPAGMRKMFCIEALVIALRPLLITLPLTVAGTGFMIRASYLNPAEFIAAAPVVPALAFSLAVMGFVGLAYYIGGKRLLGSDLSEVLRNDAIG